MSTNVKSDPLGTTCIKPKNELFKNLWVQQATELNKKNTLKLLSEICLDMKELKIEVQKDGNKKSIKAPKVEETQKNPIAIPIKEESNKVPVGEVHVSSAPNGRDGR